MELTPESAAGKPAAEKTNDVNQAAIGRLATGFEGLARRI
jgi:hypothetical protein